MRATAYKAVQERRPAMAASPQPEHNVCGQCRFFDVGTRDHNDLTDLGTRNDQRVKRACRRYPEIIFKSADEWCGEWQVA